MDEVEEEAAHAGDDAAADGKRSVLSISTSFSTYVMIQLTCTMRLAAEALRPCTRSYRR